MVQSKLKSESEKIMQETVSAPKGNKSQLFVSKLQH